MRDEVLLVIWKQGDVLMGHYRNADENAATPLTFPRDERKKGEKLVLTARRMLREMIGITQKTSHFSQLTRWTVHTKDGGRQIYVYSVRIDAHAVVLPEDVGTLREVRWIPGPHIPWKQTQLGLQPRLEWHIDHNLLERVRRA